MFELELERSRNSARLKVIGCGGAGGNAVNRMIGAGLRGVEFIVANTDTQALDSALASTKVQIGVSTTRGLGSGGNPEVGRQSAEEDEAAILEALADADMVFITAGMGGGTGTGSAPVVARLARQIGALTVAVVTKPFKFEGGPRGRNATRGIEELRAEVDTLLVIPNDRLLNVVPKGSSLVESFAVADDVIIQATKGISELITVPGLVNLDFADVKSIMTCRGSALMGTGRASGEDRARLAAEQAVASPLLENAVISGAQGVLINILGGHDLGMHEVSEAAEIITNAAGDEANIIFGAAIDPSLGNDIVITVVATGIGGAELEGSFRAKPVAKSAVSGTRAAGSEGGPSSGPADSAPSASGGDDYAGMDRPAFQRSPRSQFGRAGSRSDSGLDVPTFLRRQMD